MSALPLIAKTTNPWQFVLVGFITFLFGTSTTNALFNVLNKPAVTELEWDRAVFSNGLTIITVLTGFSILVTGFLIDRFGPKWPSVPLALMFGLGFVGMSANNGSETMFYLCCIVTGIGAAAVNPIAHSAVISAWFTARRGFALGIVMTGMGACSVMMPYLGSSLLDSMGWRGAFLVIGLLCAAIPAMGYLVFTKMPAGYEAERTKERAQKSSQGPGLIQLLRTSPQLWFLAVAIFLVSAATYGMMSQIVPIATDKGVDSSTAVAILSITGLSSMVTRFSVGYILDKIHAPIAAVAIFLLAGLGVYMLVFSSTVPLLFMGAILIGLGLGAEGDLGAYMSSRYFPKLSYGRVMGFVYFAFGQGGAFGIFLLGVVFSLTGSYEIAAWIIMALVAASIVLMFLMGPYKYSVSYKEIASHELLGSAETNTDRKTPATSTVTVDR
jgi:MFS family permease